MQPWKLNLIKSLIGAAIFGVWTWMVEVKLSTTHELLQSTLQSVFATVGITHLLMPGADVKNTIVKVLAILGTLTFLSYLVYTGYASSDVVVGDFGMLLVAFGIITPTTSNPKSDGESA